MAFGGTTYGLRRVLIVLRSNLSSEHKIDVRTRSAVLTMAAQRWVVSKWLPRTARGDQGNEGKRNDPGDVVGIATSTVSGDLHSGRNLPETNGARD
jgi:hypothetical protein